MLGKTLARDKLIGGRDKSTNTLLWIMTELMKNPTLMRKAQEEVRKLIGNKGKLFETSSMQSSKIVSLSYVLMLSLELFFILSYKILWGSES
ncbi:hypothetical protein RJ639_012010 [Escallonia herrerae]|uniref:Cytochrome P450 n=1 Tax=Escallonia herrerae TaxID=1293975 RepID=A0AA88VNE6_9ASTE|nr:hypothetical protein RJ639_012010 [Escallonia herrerae]